MIIFSQVAVESLRHHTFSKTQRGHLFNLPDFRRGQVIAVFNNVIGNGIVEILKNILFPRLCPSTFRVFGGFRVSFMKPDDIAGVNYLDVY